MAEKKRSTTSPNWISPTEVRNAHIDENPETAPPQLKAGDVVSAVVSAAAKAGDDDDDLDTNGEPMSGWFLLVFLAFCGLGLVLCK